MKLLVLGGTRFLGRHIVDVALARGDAVTIFTRGRLPVPWPREAGGGVSALVGDRDPRVAPGLAALETGRWDAAIDCSGYVPRVVEAGARLLASRVGRYIFVSSLSVYARTERPNLDEQAPVAPLADPATEQILENYGALKAACETVVERVFGGRATQARPGLIVGPFDATDRFGYWVARFVHPHLLGPRGPHAVLPAPASRPVQFVDARDLAAWLVDLAHRDAAGVFNACSPAGHWTFGDLAAGLAAESQAPPAPMWVDDAALAKHGVEPWVGLPLWIPASDGDSAGFMSIDCSRARAAGLRIRPIRATIADTAAWLATRDNVGAWKQVLSAAAERAIVDAS